MIQIIPSNQQTKEWRLQQNWYLNGKKNECEIFQKMCLEQITGHNLPNSTHLRLHFPTKDLYHLKTLDGDDAFDYTEDFDTYLFVFGVSLYFNLKFVCDPGGAQTRTLRETSHFIHAQMKHLLLFPGKKIFINILDGNQSNRSMSKLSHVLTKPEFSSVRHQVFIGDTHQFQHFWDEFLSKNNKQEEGKNMKKKKELGQFYTTNYGYILQNVSIPDDVRFIVEPFTGAGDLLNMVPPNNEHTIECYDIDPKTPDTVQRDTLIDPPCFNDKFIITNPPYLARNKCANKAVFDKYKVNDLYKCFLKELITNVCRGGVVIVPVNFWCSRRENDVQLRKKFLSVYAIEFLDIFEETVFDDTDYSVCCFQFSLHPPEKSPTDHHDICITIFPDQKHLKVVLNNDNYYMVGGEIFNLPRTHQFNITRLTRLNKDKAPTDILVKCIDDDKEISLTIGELYIDDTPNLTARSYATLVIEPQISTEKQEQLTIEFNNFLNQYREKYNSLFLSAFREHKRKRISFDLVYHIVGHLLEKLDN
jgi:hypothetical protein